GIAAVDALVLPPPHSLFACGQSRRRAPRVFCSRRSVALARDGAVFIVAFGRVQQWQLGADEIHSRRGASLLPNPGRPFLPRTSAPAERCHFGNQRPRSSVRRGGASSRGEPELAVRRRTGPGLRTRVVSIPPSSRRKSARWIGPDARRCGSCRRRERGPAGL